MGSMSIDEMLAQGPQPKGDGAQSAPAKPADDGPPFKHRHDCKQSRGKPDWVDQGNGVFKRACMCGSETRVPQPGQPPKPADDYPGWVAFKSEHGHCDAIPRLDFVDDGYWVAKCAGCQTKRSFIRDAEDHYERTGGGIMRPLDEQRDKRMEITGMPEYRQGHDGRNYPMPPRRVGE